MKIEPRRDVRGGGGDHDHTDKARCSTIQTDIRTYTLKRVEKDDEDDREMKGGMTPEKDQSMMMMEMINVRDDGLYGYMFHAFSMT